MRFDDPSLVDTFYTVDDVKQIEAERGKPYTRLRATVHYIEVLRFQIKDLERRLAKETKECLDWEDTNNHNAIRANVAEDALQNASYELLAIATRLRKTVDSTS
jgi:hypothetical protein